MDWTGPWTGLDYGLDHGWTGLWTGPWTGLWTAPGYGTCRGSFKLGDNLAKFVVHILLKSWTG